MKQDYPDIMKLGFEPLWYDENGTPRFSEFHPDLCPDIYADRVYLLLIKCQACGRQFQAEVSWRNYRGDIEYLDYGDPPAHDCVGDTMCSYNLAALQAWHRDGVWVRCPKLEKDLEDANMRE